MTTAVYASGTAGYVKMDGAVWIREHMKSHFAELDDLGLDFYHPSENVHRARRKVFDGESLEGHAWTDELMHVFKRDGCSAAWKRLLICETASGLDAIIETTGYFGLWCFGIARSGSK